MTDNDIKKALECCNMRSYPACRECAYHEQYSNNDCINKRNTDIADLINRLEAENERLKEDKKTYEGILKKCFSLEFMGKNPLAEIKAEAYKEFAERVKEEDFDRCIDVVYDGSGEVKRTEIRQTLFNKQIDNLLKEMIGE